MNANDRTFIKESDQVNLEVIPHEISDDPFWLTLKINVRARWKNGWSYGKSFGTSMLIAHAFDTYNGW